MKHDGSLDIAIGHSRETKIWKNKKWLWSDFVQALSEENRTKETYKEYIGLNKEDQADIKDVGGYVGAYLKNGKRSPKFVVHRQLLTLDIDFAHIHFWEDFELTYNNAAVLHATHKHHPNSPRFRLIIPLSRTATPDEYVAVGRWVAGELGIELFDNTTFETNRLMFWPSNPSDIDYYFMFQDGPWLDVDEVLGYYTDWTDSSLWPTAERHLDGVKDKAEKQQDPENKKGVVGAFCRAYGIEEAIEKYLSDVYKKEESGRYTYVKGSTSAGLLIYDNKFAFSHHGTDPAGGRLCNAFDLVRVHKFEDLDGKESYKEMTTLLLEDKKVKGTLTKDRMEEAQYDFAEDYQEEKDDSWMNDMELDKSGNIKSSATNLNLIFKHDHRISSAFKHNEFDSKDYVFKTLPWRKVNPPEVLRNVDYSGLRNYIESIYGVVGSLKIDDALALELEKESYHPVRDYLRSLEWDGEQRVDELLVDYFGVEDSVYSREAIRKTLVGAVARVFQPGVKFDMVLTLIGPQGTGKSTFVHKLAQSWFSDTFITVHGKEALEQIQGAWIIEIAELAGLRKAEVESIKHFISKQEDTFRPAYARKSETYYRQCVFIGTTNNVDFLRDPTGNRRFNPVEVRPEATLKNVFLELTQEEVDQIWAEAYRMYKKGEKLYLGTAAGEMATTVQEEHSEYDERIGLIEEFLNLALPTEWEEKDLIERRAFLEDGLSANGTIERNTVCTAEIWCECLGKDKKDLTRYQTRDINDLMRKFKGWRYIKSTKTFPLYGTQRYYKKIEP